MSKHRVENLRDDILVLEWGILVRSVEEGGARVVWALDEPHHTWCAESLTEMPQIIIIPGNRAGIATPVAKFACEADILQFKLTWQTG